MDVNSKLHRLLSLKPTAVNVLLAVAPPGSGARDGAHNCMKLFVAHKMMRNTLNKVHVLPRLNYRSCCRGIQLYLERQLHKVAVRLCAALKLTEKNKLLEVEGARAPVRHG